MDQAYQPIYPINIESSNTKTLLDMLCTELTSANVVLPVNEYLRRPEVERKLLMVINKLDDAKAALIGPSGCGKTTMVNILASLACSDNPPYTLIGTTIWRLDPNTILQSPLYRQQIGDVFNRLSSILGNRPAKDYVLFVDDVHLFIKNNHMEPILAAFEHFVISADFPIIMASTYENFRSLEKDSAFMSHVTKVDVPAMTKEETIRTLNLLRERYETYHIVRYGEGTLEQCVSLTEKMASSSCWPQKAIEIMDLAGVAKYEANSELRFNSPQMQKLNNKILSTIDKKNNAVARESFSAAIKHRDLLADLQKQKQELRREIYESILESPPVVTQETVAEIFSTMTGKASKNISGNISALKGMKDRMASVVIGQQEAIDKLYSGVAKSLAGFGDENRPLYSAMFIGSSGVGKTELAKQLASELFGSSEQFLRLDMSEFSEKMSVNKLHGSSPGYIGYDDLILFDKLRSNPYCVVLFDEIEKAHPDVYNVLLQILDEGHISDSKSRKISFKDTVILMTSNVGARERAEQGTGVGFKTNSMDVAAQLENVTRRALEKKFPPEFINRIDDIVYFNDLSDDTLEAITLAQINRSIEKAQKHGINLIVGNEVVKKVTQLGKDPRYGARPIKRGVQRLVDEPLALWLVENHDREKSVANILICVENDRTIAIQND